MYKKMVRDSLSPYDIYIADKFDDITKRLEHIKKEENSDMFLIYDKSLKEDYKDIIEKIKNNFVKNSFSVKCKEVNKNIHSINEIYEFLIENAAKNDAILISLGGGILGDLVGFVAGTYMRGIRYINIPTTIISQVDSSVGGKVGYNFSDFKNYIGMFYNPLEVIICIDFIYTLDKKEVLSGFGEIVKYCIIDDKDLLEYFQINIEHIKKLNKNTMLELVEKCVSIKRKVVSKDFRDKGLRNLLNFGHTVGHAIEVDSQYNISHGEAVALGILVALKISEYKLSLDKKTYSYIEEIYDLIGMNKYYKINNMDKLIHTIKGDKKNDSSIRFVLINFLGSYEIGVKVEEEDLIRAIKESIEGDKIYG